MCRLSIKYALSTPLTSDVPPQHLMCPVHSADERMPGHPAGGVPVRSGGRQYARAAAYTMLIISLEASAACQYYAGCGYRDARRLSWRLALVALSITSVMSLGPHVGAQHPCTCPPLAMKGEARNVTTQADLDLAQAHKFIQALKLNTSHSGVGYYAPAVRTTLNPCVFWCSFFA
jgi:hypothetical protein